MGDIETLNLEQRKNTAVKSDVRVFLIDSLFVLFGISSWVAINGLWVETPILVQRLPEAWNLASYIVVITQLANIGPIIYSIIKFKFSVKVCFI
jgi:riboflavin transporter 2